MERIEFPTHLPKRILSISFEIKSIHLVHLGSNIVFIFSGANFLDKFVFLNALNIYKWVPKW